MDKLFQPTLYWTLCYFSMLGLKLIYVIKGDPVLFSYGGHRNMGDWYKPSVWHSNAQGLDNMGNDMQTKDLNTLS